MRWDRLGAVAKLLGPSGLSSFPDKCPEQPIHTTQRYVSVLLSVEVPHNEMKFTPYSTNLARNEIA